MGAGHCGWRNHAHSPTAHMRFPMELELEWDEEQIKLRNALVGVTWGEMHRTLEYKRCFHKDGNLYLLRFGNFLRIPSVAIISNKRYVALRYVKPVRYRAPYHPFAGVERDKSSIGDWWILRYPLFGEACFEAISGLKYSDLIINGENHGTRLENHT